MNAWQLQQLQQQGQWNPPAESLAASLQEAPRLLEQQWQKDLQQLQQLQQLHPHILSAASQNLHHVSSDYRFVDHLQTPSLGVSVDSDGIARVSMGSGSAPGPAPGLQMLQRTEPDAQPVNHQRKHASNRQASQRANQGPEYMGNNQQPPTINKAPRDTEQRLPQNKQRVSHASNLSSHTQTPSAKSEALPRGKVRASIASEVAQRSKEPQESFAAEVPQAPPNEQCLLHDGQDGVPLVERIRRQLSELSAESLPLVIELSESLTEDEALEISSGEVTIRGKQSSPGSKKVRLTLPGVRVRGGSLQLCHLQICALEENCVQGGRLQCEDCSITSRRGCGVLCLQKAKVSLTDCEVVHCMRSGIGVNGKQTEIEMTRCSVKQNNFSGMGVNHQARCILLRDCELTQNSYHGIWLNAGVVARWQGGSLSGNKLLDKDGAGKLIGYSSPHADVAPVS